tara:strand:+ start:5560 stop:7005 length:1446 start_codon:yes stop_codon:yes gene_type:complete
MKFNKSALFVILLIIIIIPLLARKALGSIVEPFSANNVQIKYGEPESTTCLTRGLNDTINIGNCMTGENPNTNSQWNVGEKNTHVGGYSIQSAEDPTKCLTPAYDPHMGPSKDDIGRLEACDGTGGYGTKWKQLHGEAPKVYNMWKELTGQSTNIQMGGPEPGIVSRCLIGDDGNQKLGDCPTGNSKTWNVVQVPAAAPIKLASCSSLSPFGEEDENDPLSLLNNIKYFQKEELSILNKLKELANVAEPNTTLIDRYTKAIKPFQQSRMRLMQQLNNVSAQTQCSIATDRRALQDQIALLAVVEKQLTATEQETGIMLDHKGGKKRMVEITNYENLRYTSHKNIFKTIAFCSLFVLAGIYLNKGGGKYMSWLGSPIIVTAIAVATFLTVKRIWWNAYRNPMNWNQFMWETPSKNQQTVWEYDVNAFNIAKNNMSADMNSMTNTVSNEAHELQKTVQGLGREINSTAQGKGKNLSKSFATYN